MTTILVTGATGTVGTQTIEALSKVQGAQVRAGVRSAQKAAALKKGNVTPVDFDYGNAASVKAALAGVDHVFLLTPFDPNQVQMGKALVDAAKAAGVKHVVKLSALGSNIEPGIQLGRWHREVEKHLEASGLGWTILRPNNFMQNFVNYYPPDKEGVIYLPWGQGKCSWIDARDLGAVAAKVLTSAGHEGKGYDLTGPEALGIADVAAELSKVSGRTIKYVDVPEDAAKSAMLGMGMPAFAVDAMMELHAIDKAGYAAAVTPVVEQLLGRKPRSFAEFAREHASAWKQ